MKTIRLALLDMNNNHANQGMRNILELSQQFQEICDEDVSISIFDVRYKNQVPNVEDFDIFISSGGPGTPHKEGYEWEKKYATFLDDIWAHNQTSDVKKFLFLICHSFQLASIHWELGNICKRKSFSFGVMPIHRTVEGDRDFLLKNLNKAFYAVDSRSYQFIEPNMAQLETMNMEIIALEKIRPHIHLERAVMALKFSNEIYGTQFHPEADPSGMLRNLEIEQYRAALIRNYGVEKYLETIDRLEDDDKILFTRREILPRFLNFAKNEIMNHDLIENH